MKNRISEETVKIVFLSIVACFIVLFSMTGKAKADIMSNMQTNYNRALKLYKQNITDLIWQAREEDHPFWLASLSIL